MWCARQRRRDVADLLHQVRRDVVGHAVVHHDVACGGALHPDHRRQRLEVDHDPVDDVLGDVPVDGDDHHDGLADVVDHVGRERVTGPRLGQAGVRDQQGQRLGDPLGQVVVGVDGDQPVDVERGVDVDAGDPGVRVGAAHERDLVRVVPEVVEVAALAAQQARVLAPGDGLAEQLRRHRSAPRSSGVAGTPPPAGLYGAGGRSCSGCWCPATTSARRTWSTPGSSASSSAARRTDRRMLR